jgi:isoquinoline 1-oxidoreductase beta subunit
MCEWERKRDATALGVAYNHGGRRNGQIAEVVEVSLDSASGAIKVHKVWAAADAGTAIQPRHLRQQLETGMIWGLSAALRERVVIKDGVVQQSNFNDYPVPRMDEIPEIHIELIDGGPGRASGAGPIAGLPQAPLAPAIANALYRLSGVRLRAMPMLAARVKTALLAGADRIEKNSIKSNA